MEYLGHLRTRDSRVIFDVGKPIRDQLSLVKNYRVDTSSNFAKYLNVVEMFLGFFTNELFVFKDKFG